MLCGRRRDGCLRVPCGQVQQLTRFQPRAVDARLPGRHEDRVLEVGPQREDAIARMVASRQLRADDRRERGRRRSRSGQVARQHGDAEAAETGRRQLAVMLEGRLNLAAGVRERNPELHAVQRGIVLGRRLLSVRDAAARRHEVELPGPDQLLGAEAVPVQHVPGQEPGHGLQADMRMRWHIHPGDAVDVHRPVVIDEAPGTDASAQPERQHAADGHGHRRARCELALLPGRQARERGHRGPPRSLRRCSRGSLRSGRCSVPGPSAAWQDPVRRGSRSGRTMVRQDYGPPGSQPAGPRSGRIPV